MSSEPMGGGDIKPWRWSVRSLGWQPVLLAIMMDRLWLLVGVGLIAAGSPNGINIFHLDRSSRRISLAVSSASPQLVLVVSLACPSKSLQIGWSQFMGVDYSAPVSEWLAHCI